MKVFQRRSSAASLAASTIPRFQERLQNVSLDAAQSDAVRALSEPTRHGFYLWGGVGRGKSLIADAYFASIPTQQKRRVHFHEFFRDLHAEIGRRHGTFDQLLGDAHAVLFDEFHVHDVANGVYLASTIQTILERDVLLIATSNYAPDALMPNPYFHDGFQPTIDVINSAFDVVHLGDGVDYRGLGTAGDGFSSGTWTIGGRSIESDAAIFDAAGLPIEAVSATGGVAEFDFRELCVRPLGSEQYLWIAEHFARVSIVGVPSFASLDRETLMRFCNLVDVFYDRNVELHVTAEDLPSGILAAAPLRDAGRTVSRLSTLSYR